MNTVASNKINTAPGMENFDLVLSVMNKNPYVEQTFNSMDRQFGNAKYTTVV